MKAPALPIPHLAADGATLRSLSANDVYFSAEGGMQETEFVFLANNHLPARWQHTPRFVIGETGFGTGLNFLTTWQAFDASHAPGELFFLSVEKFPLTPEQLAAALAHFSELAPYTAQLLAQYPLRIAGWHRIAFGRVILWLGLGEATELFQQMQAQVNAWFLDGFAPAKNPDMWSDALMDEVARLSAADASFATFTAAGDVRRKLEARGFTVEKIAGFGRKRAMLRGCLSGTGERSVITPSQPTTLIIGGGIAGCSTAYALAARGCDVTLLDAGEIASGASGNPAGVLYPQLGKQWNAAIEESFLAYAAMLRNLTRWKDWDFRFASPGMLKYPKDADERVRLANINTQLGLDSSVAHWIERDEAEAKTGLPLRDGGAWFAHGTWVAAAELCRALLQHPRITTHTHAPVTALKRVGEAWQAQTQTQTFAASHIVLACGVALKTLLPDAPVTLYRSAGQLNMLPRAAVAQPLRSIFCHKGYVVPLADHYLIGATYDHEDLSLALRPEHTQKNLAELAQYLPGWLKHGDISLPEGRMAHRVTTPNRRPLVGALGAAYPNLYVNTAHGSRGLLSAPYGAEAIADTLLGTPCLQPRG
jgi:tRNA 5-methylaminomethyl-2-thiouridine biosynthesis bifunctional protein